MKKRRKNFLSLISRRTLSAASLNPAAVVSQDDFFQEVMS